MAESTLRPDSTLSSGLIHVTLKLNLMKTVLFPKNVCPMLLTIIWIAINNIYFQLLVFKF